MPKVLNKRTDVITRRAVYVGRPSPFGNPYIIGVHGTRKQCVELFEKVTCANPKFVKKVKEKLKGKDLVCWCAPEQCHADVLLKIANS